MARHAEVGSATAIAKKKKMMIMMELEHEVPRSRGGLPVPLEIVRNSDGGTLFGTPTSHFAKLTTIS